MKKLVALVVLMLMAAPSFAGVGVHINYDSKTIDSDLRTFGYEGETYTATMGRNESEKPIGAGIDFGFTLLPIVDLTFSIEGAFARYTAEYTTTYPGFEGLEKEVGFMRLGLDATATINVLSIPPVASLADVFVGGGPSFMVTTPIWSEDLIRDNIESAAEPVDPVDLADELNFRFGVHLAAGVKISPPAIPLYVRVMAKYYMLPGVDEPDLANWMTISAGVGIGG